MAVELNSRTLLLEHLAGVLREMETVCIDLCNVAVLKKDGLKKMSLPEVDAAVKREAVLLERLRNTDEKRRLVFTQIAGVFGMDPDTLTVKDLLPRLPENYQRSLTAGREKLQAALQRLAKINTLNYALSEQGLAHVGEFLRLLTGTGVGPLVYGRPGDAGRGPGGVKNIVDKVG